MLVIVLICFICMLIIVFKFTLNDCALKTYIFCFVSRLRALTILLNQYCGFYAILYGCTCSSYIINCFIHDSRILPFAIYVTHIVCLLCLDLGFNNLVYSC